MWEFLDDMAHCMGRVVEGIDLCKDTIVSLMTGKPADRYMYMDCISLLQKLLSDDDNLKKDTLEFNIEYVTGSITKIGNCLSDFTNYYKNMQLLV